MSYRRDKTTPVNLYQMQIICLVLPVSLEWKCEWDQCCNVWKTHACNAVLQALRIALWSWGNKGLKFWKKSARLETHLAHQKTFYSQYCSTVCRSCSLRCEITWSFIKEKFLLAEKNPFLQKDCQEAQTKLLLQHYKSAAYAVLGLPWEYCAYGCSMARMAKLLLSAVSADLGLLECHSEIIESGAAKGHCSPLVSSICATKTKVLCSSKLLRLLSVTANFQG